MACYFIVIFVLLSFTSGSPVYKNHERRKESYFSPKKIVDSTVHISEAGEEYNEKIEVDPNKRTELFHVPVDPGVDRIDTLHDFKRLSVPSSQDVEDLRERKERGSCPCLRTCGSCFCCIA